MAKPLNFAGKLIKSSDLIAFLRDCPEVSQESWEAFIGWHMKQPDASEPLRERVAELEADKQELVNFLAECLAHFREDADYSPLGHPKYDAFGIKCIELINKHKGDPNA